MKYVIIYQCKVWHAGKVQRIEDFKLHTALAEFARLIRLPGVIYAKLFQDKKLIANYVADDL